MRLSVLMIAFTIIFNTIAQLLLKFNTVHIIRINIAESIPFLAKFLQPFLLLAVLTYGISFVCYSIALKGILLNKAFPIVNSLTYILVYILAAAFFHENINYKNIFGLSMIIIGIFLVADFKI